MRSVIPLFMLLVCVSGATAMPAGNYIAVGELIQGFMNGFFNTTFALNQNCMSSAFQSQVDSHIVATFETLLFYNLTAAVTYAQIFTSDLNSLITTCNISNVESAVLTEYNNTGLPSLLFYAGLNMVEFVPEAAKIYADLLAENYTDMGLNLGNIMRVIFNPYSFNPQAQSQKEKLVTRKQS